MNWNIQEAILESFEFLQFRSFRFYITRNNLKINIEIGTFKKHLFSNFSNSCNSIKIKIQFLPYSKFSICICHTAGWSIINSSTIHTTKKPEIFLFITPLFPFVIIFSISHRSASFGKEKNWPERAVSFRRFCNSWTICLVNRMFGVVF